MLATAGFDPIGLIHTALGIAALYFGGMVLYLRKGTRLHRRGGYAYASSMVFLNASALGDLRFVRWFGVTRRPTQAWLRLHDSRVCRVLISRWGRLRGSVEGVACRLA
jgi:hypothetical protein